MKIKIADLNFYAFIEFLKILETKFPKLFFDYNNDLDFYLSITAIPRHKTDVGDISLQIRNPVDSILKNDNPTKVDLSDKFITFQLYVDSWNSINLTVKQEVFDDEGFIQVLTNLIGKVAPVRRDCENNWHEEIKEWIFKEIEDAGLKTYCFKIEEAK